jgi:hypothetical protein
MKKNIIPLTILLCLGSQIFTMDPVNTNTHDPLYSAPWSNGAALCRTYAMDPRFPETCCKNGETIEQRNARVAQEKNMSRALETEIEGVQRYLELTSRHPFEDSPDLLAPKGTSPTPPRSPKQITAELVAQAAANRAQLEFKK